MGKAKKGSKENPVTKEELENLDARNYKILEAQIKDGFCNYKFEITSGVGAGQVHSVSDKKNVVDGETETSVRENILTDFKAGKIRCVINVGVLTTGFDFPELESILMAFSTMSLSKYYQVVGRVMRPHKNKADGWVVDLGGNIKKFGKIETMEIKKINGFYSVWNNGRQLTDVTFSKN